MNGNHETDCKILHSLKLLMSECIVLNTLSSNAFLLKFWNKQMSQPESSKLKKWILKLKDFSLQKLFPYFCHQRYPSSQWRYKVVRSIKQQLMENTRTPCLSPQLLRDSCHDSFKLPSPLLSKAVTASVTRQWDFGGN